MTERERKIKIKENLKGYLKRYLSDYDHGISSEVIENRDIYKIFIDQEDKSGELCAKLENETGS